MASIIEGDSHAQGNKGVCYDLLVQVVCDAAEMPYPRYKPQGTPHRQRIGLRALAAGSRAMRTFCTSLFCRLGSALQLNFTVIAFEQRLLTAQIQSY